jgi:GxxExxY protein
VVVILDEMRATRRPEGAPFVTDDVTERIIGAAFEVHNIVGAGLLESTYEESLCIELQRLGIACERQLLLAIEYKGVTIPGSYRVDVLVEKQVLVEVKAIEAITTFHYAQVRTYLHHARVGRGLLINFNAIPFAKGIRRIQRE